MTRIGIKGLIGTGTSALGALCVVSAVACSSTTTSPGQEQGDAQTQATDPTTPSPGTDSGTLDAAPVTPADASPAKDAAPPPDAGADPCFDAPFIGYYCGESFLAQFQIAGGDTGYLYFCGAAPDGQHGKTTSKVKCANGCFVAPAGSNDHCN